MSIQRQRLKVSATTKPQDLAGAVAKFMIQDRQAVEIVCIGAGSNQQCFKAMVIARRYVASAGINLGFIPALETIYITQADGEKKEITANKWLPVEL